METRERTSCEHRPNVESNLVICQERILKENIINN